MIASLIGYFTKKLKKVDLQTEFTLCAYDCIMISRTFELIKS